MRWLLQKIILGVIANAATVYIVAHFLGEYGFKITPNWGFFVIGTFIGVLNMIVKPILSLISLPFVIITFGLFLMVINAFLLYITELLINIFLTDYGLTFTVGEGFIIYFIAAALLSIINSFMHFFLTRN